MKYYYDDKEITRKQAFKIINNFVKERFNQEFTEFTFDIMFKHPPRNTFLIIDSVTGDKHVVSGWDEIKFPKPEVEFVNQ